MSNLDEILADLDQDVPVPEGRHKVRAKRPPLPDKYVKVLDFNPDSYQQVAALCTHLGVKLPRRKDSDDEEALSTEKKFLLRASRRHPVLRTVLDCRERWKMVSTYNWKLRPDSTVGTTIGHHPSTWRKSSREYNLQNVPKRSSLANEFRKMIVAPPGHLLLEGDSSAIEAVLVGYFARSQRYINLAKAGVHDWFNALMHGEGFSPDLPLDELKVLCKAAKAKYDPESREVSKRCVHLSAYRGTPERMAEEYPDEFPTVASARKPQGLLLSSPPGQDLQAWWKDTLARAGHDKFLCNPFGGRHRFFHIFTYNKRRQCFEANGDDAKRAIAYLPQSTASAIQDLYVLALWETPFKEWLRMVIHDSCLAIIPENELDNAASIMYEVMQSPIAELGGLEIGAEVKWGRNWGEMSTWTPGSGRATT